MFLTLLHIGPGLYVPMHSYCSRKPIMYSNFTVKPCLLFFLTCWRGFNTKIFFILTLTINVEPNINPFRWASESWTSNLFCAVAYKNLVFHHPWKVEQVHMTSLHFVFVISAIFKSDKDSFINNNFTFFPKFVMGIFPVSRLREFAEDLCPIW